MTDHERIKVEKKKEMRTKEISKMISEGGLGADHYYNIKKEKTSEKDTISQEKTNEKNENSNEE